MSLTEIEREQLEERYHASDLVDALGLDVCEIIDAFKYEVEDKLHELLDKERGIGL